MNSYEMPAGKDPYLWELAYRRASFKRHLRTYLVMSVFFWAVWYLSGANRNGSGFPWPVWPMLGWGIGVLFHYFNAYVTPKSNSAEKEYDRLTKQ